MRHLALPLLVALAGCAAPLDDLDGDPDGIGGKADSAVAALEGTREGYGVLRLLNDGEGTTFAFLDDTVALDRRSAQNLVAHRDGADGAFGTSDDDLFDSIEEVDGVSWVGPATLEQLAEFALLNDYVPGDDQLLGTFDGIAFTYAEAESVLAFANGATEDELADASVPSRAITSILDARPIVTVAILADLYWVGPRTLEHLKAAVALPIGGEPCESTADCPSELRCVGRAEGWGKCRDTATYPGMGDECDTDADCGERQICAGASVYGYGWCSSEWMRESFVDGGAGSIPEIVMDTPTGRSLLVSGQATVPQDIFVDLEIEHTDPSSLWIGLQPPTGQEPVTLWDGATMTGPIPSHFVDRSVYRDDAVNGRWTLLVQNVGGRGEGRVGTWTLTVTSRWD